MTIDQPTLHDLCLRVAAGDERARGDFNRHVPPLVEVVVHRWLRQQAATAGISASATLSSRSRQVADEICARYDRRLWRHVQQRPKIKRR